MKDDTMSDAFFEKPILNSPYEIPQKHWQLDDRGQPTQQLVEKRRPSSYVTPIPSVRKISPKSQDELILGDAALSSKEQIYDTNSLVNEVRKYVSTWRNKDVQKCHVTPETGRLLHHWRNHHFNSIRPFFCQVEAVETLIWLTEVAPKMGSKEKNILANIKAANNEANPELLRIALKLATGAGKTTVMAMIIAWQTVNAVRRPESKNYTTGFLVVAPGITIKERLRVLFPNDPDSYYKSRELVPSDMVPQLLKAKIVITNYHAFKLRERLDVAKGGRALLKGRRGEEIQSLETEGQMVQRVIPELMGMKHIMVINDEAHHCYREKPGEDDVNKLRGDEKDEAKKNNEAARLWISGIEMVKRKIGVKNVIDLSATPFFLRGSGYEEGTLFPWTVSDFSLMDAIESGIVKLPRVPVADNIQGEEMPKFRNLWEHVGKRMPKKGRSSKGTLDPLNLPIELQSALDALYGHYEKVYKTWENAGLTIPPCLIVVCNNTASSKLVYDYIAGFKRECEDGTEEFNAGRLELFRNYDEHGNQLPRPRTLLIDSMQLESGDALDKEFRSVAAEEIERFKREIIERTGNADAANKISEQELLREVMNTVGKNDRLGESIRCVVSVSMLTEGWDANNVTHILGVRAFGTQLLCEQVIGRALRRQSYELNEEGLFNVEYADVFGVPFDFTAKAVAATIVPPKETINVKAISPERDASMIHFPRVMGYRINLPKEKLSATFTDDSVFELTPDIVGPAKTTNAGIIGESQNFDLSHLESTRTSTIIFHLATHLLMTKWREPNEEPNMALFGQLKRIAREWFDNHLVCKGGTYPALLLYRELADIACDRITHAIVKTYDETNDAADRIKALLDPYNPTGSTEHVNFNTSKTLRYKTDSRKCHINWVILDSEWEGEFCRVAEANNKVVKYVKNHALGFEIPYMYGGQKRTYIPDFIVLIDDGKGRDNPLHLVVEIKGYRGEDAKEKANTMNDYWVRGVNNAKIYGRWAFAEFTDVFAMEADFKQKIEHHFNKMIENTQNTKGE